MLPVPLKNKVRPESTMLAAIGVESHSMAMLLGELAIKSMQSMNNQKEKHLNFFFFPVIHIYQKPDFTLQPKKHACNNM